MVILIIFGLKRMDQMVAVQEDWIFVFQRRSGRGIIECQATSGSMPEEPLVEPLYERESDSVPGPFYLKKDACVLCALPPQTAPQNITWSALTFRGPGGEDCPKHCRIERQPETPEEFELVMKAACGSCVEAIRYCGTDPMVLARFPELGYERLCDAITRDTI
jgi:hypothetical protein